MRVCRVCGADVGVGELRPEGCVHCDAETECVLCGHTRDHHCDECSVTVSLAQTLAFARCACPGYMPA